MAFLSLLSLGFPMFAVGGVIAVFAAAFCRAFVKNRKSFGLSIADFFVKSGFALMGLGIVLLLSRSVIVGVLP